MPIAHVDMDCFYCACEESRDHSLKGKPVIVGATGDRGVVSAANYEARKYGVFSATPISKARRLCPDGIYLAPDWQLYDTLSHKVMRVLLRFSKEIVQVSIDEAYLEISADNDAYETALKIQKAVLAQTGLSCSIGIASSKMIAKIATDFKKPHGITLVQDPVDFLSPLAIEKIPGIGKVSKNYYHQCGIHTIGDLIAMDRFKVIDSFGMYGVRLQQIAKGEIIELLQQYGPQKSVSRERTFYSDVSEQDLLHKTLTEICKEVHEDLDIAEFKTVSLKLRYADFTTITREISLHGHTHSLAMITRCVQELFSNHMDPQKSIRLLGVKLSNLLYENAQQTSLEAFSGIIV